MKRQIRKSAFRCPNYTTLPQPSRPSMNFILLNMLSVLPKPLSIEEYNCRHCDSMSVYYSDVPICICSHNKYSNLNIYRSSVQAFRPFEYPLLQIAVLSAIRTHCGANYATYPSFIHVVHFKFCKFFPGVLTTTLRILTRRFTER